MFNCYPSFRVYIILVQSSEDETQTMRPGTSELPSQTSQRPWMVFWRHVSLVVAGSDG